MAPPKKERAPGWGKEAVLRELEDGLGITEICAKYAAEAAPASLKSEVTRWLAEDEQFASEYTRIVGAENERPRGDISRELLPQYANWKLDFCNKLFETGDRLAATTATPYDYSSICKKLNVDDKVYYDEEFAEMVRYTQLQLCGRVEAVVTNTVFDPEVPADKRALIGIKILERQDPKRWGRQVEMIHSGKIQHENVTPALPREQRLAALASELGQFMLPANTQSQPPAADFVDVHVLDAVPVSGQS